MRTHATWVRAGGMFLPTGEVDRLALGRQIGFEVRLESGEVLLEGKGRVVWRASPTLNPFERTPIPGVGLKFLELTPASRELVDQLCGEPTSPGDGALPRPADITAWATAAEPRPSGWLADISLFNSAAGPKVEPREASAQREEPPAPVENSRSTENAGIEHEGREARLRAEEAQARSELEARIRAEEVSKLDAREAQLRAAEANARAELEARLRAEEVSRLAAREGQLRAEHARGRAETEARVRADESVRLQALEAQLREEQARQLAELEARVRAEHARALGEQEALLRVEAQRRAKAETDAAAARQEAERLSDALRTRTAQDAALAHAGPVDAVQMDAERTRRAHTDLEARQAVWAADLARVEAQVRLEAARAQTARAETARIEATLQTERQAEAQAEAQRRRAPPSAAPAGAPANATGDAQRWFALGLLAAAGQPSPDPSTSALDPTLQLAVATLRASKRKGRKARPAARSVLNALSLQLPAVVALVVALAALRGSGPSLMSSAHSIPVQPAVAQMQTVKVVEVPAPPPVETPRKTSAFVAVDPPVVIEKSSPQLVEKAVVAKAESDDVRPKAETKARVRTNPVRASGDAAALARQGDAALRSGRIDEALDSFNKALAVDSRHAAAHRGMGAVLTMQGKDSEAAASYRKYLSLAPNATDRGRIEALLEDMK